jgi:hypothetical protein
VGIVPQVANKYHNAVKSTNTPHIFAIADQAYHNMKKSGKNQCAVVRSVYIRAAADPIRLFPPVYTTHTVMPR